MSVRSRLFHRPPRWLAATVGLAGVITTLPTAGVAATPRAAIVRTTQGGGPIVATAAGPLRGLTTPTAQAFLGIPYAAPPVGVLRWRPPAPLAPGAGVLDATAQRSACPQLSSSNGPTVTDEDCLFLNVYRPLRSPDAAPLPVLFWIHGGGFLTGSGNQFDGQVFAAANDAVVVTVNYRLGAFGFLAVPQLLAQDPAVGDLGLLDQQAALRWTQRNIAAFGGDPRAVTIAGESAGGWAVCDQLASPTAAGLFRAAIIESGSCVTNTRAQAEALAAPVIKAAGCATAAVVACLRSKSSSQLLQASARFPTFPQPYPGVAVLPDRPYQAIRAGRWNRVPVLLGNNHDEARIFVAGVYPLSAQDYARQLAATFGALAPQVLAQYPAAAYAQPFYAYSAALTDASELVGACVTQANAGILQRAGAPTYEYEFDDRTAPPPVNVPYALGAYHSAELQFLWPGYDGHDVRRFDVPEQQLSQAMIRYWGAFVRTGDPNYIGGVLWPRYVPAAGAVLALRPGGDVVTHAFTADHHCGFWASVESIPLLSGPAL